MKKPFNYIVLAAMALGAVACSQDDLATSYLSDSKAVHISVQIGENYVSGEFGTRSNPLGVGEEQTKFNPGDKIAVTADNQDYVVYTLDENNTWMPAPNKYLLWKSEMMTFGAYYPVDVNGASMQTFNQPTNYSSITDLANADYMTFSGELSNTTSNAVTLQMKRKMARLIIKTSFKDQFESGYEVSSIKIHSNASGYVGGAVNRSEEGTEITTYKHGEYFYALLVPTSVDADKTFLTITVKNVDNPDTENLTVKGIPATQDGYSYEMTVVVGKDKASVGEVKVSDWKTGGIIEGTAVELVPSVDAKSHTIVTTAEDQLNDAILSEALYGNASSLVIEGPLSSRDISTLHNFINNIYRTFFLDMAKAEIDVIPEKAFQNNSFLGHVWLPTKLKVIGNQAFENARKCIVKNFNDLEKLETIGIQALKDALQNGSIIIPQTVKSIGEGAFQGTSIESIKFPSNIRIANAAIIKSCSRLTSVIFDGDIREISIDNILYLSENGCVIDLSQTNSVPQHTGGGILDIETSGNFNMATGYLNVKFIVKKGLESAYKANDCWKYCIIEETE